AEGVPGPSSCQRSAFRAGPALACLRRRLRLLHHQRHLGRRAAASARRRRCPPGAVAAHRPGRPRHHRGAGTDRGAVGGAGRPAGR
ncbi:MAG: hypothetical protein AVDCRST_MAG61-2410, partial [uncultured Friedmanniella sp.]